MVESHESIDEIETVLDRARHSLRSFEDGVDYRRLLMRLRTASPAHPVLLARYMFGSLALLCMIAAVVVLVIPLIDTDLARALVKFESVIPYVPDGVPALPAMFGLLATCMVVGWAMCTGAALAIGREAQMLHWEQRQHQSLVNEVTRLTTQRAVMERIRNTPVSSRPRIGTPVPTSSRSRGPTSGYDAFSRTPTPAYLGRAPEPDPIPGGFGRTPYGAPAPRATPAPSLRRSSPGVTPPGSIEPSGGAPSATPAYNPRQDGPRPLAPWESPAGVAPMLPPSTASWSPAPTSPAPAPSAMSSLPSWADPEPDPLVEEIGIGGPPPDPVPLPRPPRVPPPPTPPPELQTVVPQHGMVGLGGNPAFSSSPDGGVRLGAPATDDDSLPTEAISTSAARRAPPVRSSRRAPSKSPPAPLPGVVQPAEVVFEDLAAENGTGEGGAGEAVDSNGILARARAGAYANRATPWGSAGRIRPANAAGTSRAQSAPPVGPRVTQRITPLGAPDGPARSTTGRSPDSSIFGTPPPIVRSTEPPSTVTAEVRMDDDDDDYDDDSPTVLANMPVASLADPPSAEGELVPDLDQVQDQWLRDALAKADQLVQNFPVQAQIAFSREPNLPFTLVINRATPAMSVRAMVNFVEFLAGIYTPPRARIELHSVAHLDKSFHRNVEAALEPYFGNNVVVEPGRGKVDIRFTDPDPGWGQYPHLPMR